MRLQVIGKGDDMKVLLINGSPKEKGCTYTAREETARTLREEGIETEIFWLGRKAFHGCEGCGACARLGRCVHDDEANVIAKKLETADGLILGSPVHYASASGAITAVMDRVFYSTPKQYLMNKPGAAVCSARRAGTTATLEQLNKYFTISNMPLVSSQYWNMVHGNTPEEVQRDEEGMQIMRQLGRNMAWMLKCIEAGRKAGVPDPEHETRVGTNFIRM